MCQTSPKKICLQAQNRKMIVWGFISDLIHYNCLQTLTEIKLLTGGGLNLTKNSKPNGMITTSSELGLVFPSHTYIFSLKHGGKFPSQQQGHFACHASAPNSDTISACLMLWLDPNICASNRNWLSEWYEPMLCKRLSFSQSWNLML